MWDLGLRLDISKKECRDAKFEPARCGESTRRLPVPSRRSGEPVRAASPTGEGRNTTVVASGVASLQGFQVSHS
jgi:hypothetical protein